jgi:hypothetical protein
LGFFTEELDMDSRSKVLLLDDGDLFRIERMLKEFEVELEHLRGDVIREDLEGSPDVVIATVKRILALEGSVDLTGLPGKPVWIAVHSQDFLPLRVRLRKLGVHFLVQSSVGSEALRLLLAHAVYRGSEKREELRLPVGSPVKYRDAGENTFAAELLDLARDGCRLLSDHAPQPGSALSVRLPSKLAGGEELSLPGRIVRVDPHAGSGRNLVTVSFDEIAEEAVEPLNAILEGKVIGTVVTRLGDDLSEATASTTVPGRRAPEPARERAPEPAPEPPAGPDLPPHERFNRRVVYTRKVTALLPCPSSPSGRCSSWRSTVPRAPSRCSSRPSCPATTAPSEPCSGSRAWHPATAHASSRSSPGNPRSGGSRTARRTSRSSSRAPAFDRSRAEPADRTRSTAPPRGAAAAHSVQAKRTPSGPGRGVSAPSVRPITLENYRSVLRWKDVDLRRRTLSVQRGIVEVNGRIEVSEPKSSKRRRRVELSELAVHAMREHRRRLGTSPHPEAWVFADSKGGPMRKNNFARRSWWPLRKRAGLDGVRFHDLRHTAASLLLSAGVHPKVVQARLGHSTVALTLDVYSHVLGSLQRDAADRIDDLLG